MSEPGSGAGWERLRDVVAGALPVEEIDGVWVFAPIRRGPWEWGTAIVSQVHGERRRIHTARYAMAIKGKERGKYESSMEEVGSGPIEALSELLHEVRKRLDDEEPPVALPLERWWPDHAERVAAARVAAAEAPVADEAEGAAHVPVAEEPLEPPEPPEPAETESPNGAADRG